MPLKEKQNYPDDSNINQFKTKNFKALLGVLIKDILPHRKSEALEIGNLWALHLIERLKRDYP